MTVAVVFTMTSLPKLLVEREMGRSAAPYDSEAWEFWKRLEHAELTCGILEVDFRLNFLYYRGPQRGRVWCNDIAWYERLTDCGPHISLPETKL